MRSLVAIQAARSMCANALDGKSLSVYTAYDYDLRTQRSVLEKIEKQYSDYVVNSELVRKWCAEYEAKNDRVSHVIAAVWRWALEDEMQDGKKSLKKLPFGGFLL